MIRKIYTAAVACAVSMSVQAAPVARWLETTHDFGAFDENMGVVNCTFKAVNDGDEPLVILNARANCGCTRPSYSTDPVAPGDTLVVSVGFDPNGRPGRFTKYIRIDTNALPAKSELKITGSVIAATNTVRSRYPIDLGSVKLRDKIVAFGQVDKGKSAGKYVEGYNASHDTISPRVARLPEYVSARIDPAVVPPGEQFVIATVAYTDKTDQWGIVTDEFDFYPTSTSTDAQQIETVVIVKEDFSKMTPEQLRDAPVIKVEPARVDMGEINPGATEPVEGSFEILNTGKNPLIIRSVKCADNAVTVTKVKSDVKIKNGKRLKVTFKVDPKQLKERSLLNARIIITANDPADPSTTVRVVGQIKK